MLSLNRNQHGLRESLPLIALNVGAQLSLAAGSKRNQSEPSVKQEGLYTALCSESVMVITQPKRLELPKMNVINRSIINDCLISLGNVYGFFQLFSLYLRVQSCFQALIVLKGLKSRFR